VLQILALGGIGVGVGFILSRRFLNRVERLRRTAEAVGRGRLSERIPVEGRDDDFDQVAAEINRMLGRIQGLVEESRRVASEVAHDLRTPLGAVRRKLESLLEMLKDDDARALCEQARASLDATLETFSALLRISELESGRSELPFERFDVSELLTRLHETYEPVASARGQELELDVPPAVRIIGDRALVTQLAVNLVENAIRHNAAGVHIRIAARGHADGGSIDVVDDGVGIPEASMADVVKPFFRGDRSRRAPGSGLGLCLAARIAERHGSTLDLSDAGPGLRASVTFRDRATQRIPAASNDSQNPGQ
jgi:signal transduction histidine kinase